MKKLFDVKCKNIDCSEFDVIKEVLMNYNEPPECQECKNKLYIAITKTPSVYLKGGKNSGFYNDGFLNTGKSKAVRRIAPKASRESNEK